MLAALAQLASRLERLERDIGGRAPEAPGPERVRPAAAPAGQPPTPAAPRSVEPRPAEHHAEPHHANPRHGEQQPAGFRPRPGETTPAPAPSRFTPTPTPATPPPIPPEDDAPSMDHRTRIPPRFSERRAAQPGPTSTGDEPEAPTPQVNPQAGPRPEQPRFVQGRAAGQFAAQPTPGPAGPNAPGRAAGPAGPSAPGSGPAAPEQQPVRPRPTPQPSPYFEQAREHYDSVREGRPRRRLVTWAVLILLLIAAGGAGYVFLTAEPQIAPADMPEQTATPETDATGTSNDPDAATTAGEIPLDEQADAPIVAEAEPTTAEPERPQAGPAVNAAPATAIETAALGERADPAEMAALPTGAPEELQSLSALAIDGNAEAQHDLATAFALGDELPQDLERAAYWYGRSANGGVVNAQYNLGVLTERGDGVPQDSGRAFDLFLAAAESGHPDAQNAVGLAYMNGRGVERNLTEAATWFQAASGNGNPRGAYHLGRLFEQGLDGAPDLAAAAGWYRVAAEAGDAEAQAALDRITETTGQPAPDTPTPVTVPAPGSTPPPVPAGGGTETAEVTPGMIREIQQILGALEYNAGPADGLLGDRTIAAIAAFQRDRDLTVTGQPSADLLAALRQAAE
ncbi:MAG TPA: peptidoglycan-binding protein [Paracoccaceae bacterium]|nr:peptidoglycan-binding protein [Paracoccaceae bacterium]